MSTLDEYDVVLSRRLGTTSETFHTDEARTAAINYAVQEFTDEYKPEEFRKKEFITLTRYGDTVDAFEYATDGAIQAVWTESDDGVAPTSSTTYNEGSYSGSFSWTNSSNTATWTGAVTSNDYSSYTGRRTGTPVAGFLFFYFNFTDYTAHSAFTIRIGNDSSNYGEYAVTIANDNNWGSRRLPLKDFTYTGTVDWTAVDWVQIEITESSSSSFLLDAMKVIPANSDWMVGSFPSDLSTLNRVLMVEDLDTGSEYLKTDPDEFYRREGDVCTYDYSMVDAGLRFFLNDTTVYQVLVHYIQDPTTMSIGSDDSLLSDKSIELIALLALRRLLLNAGEYEASQYVEQTEIRNALASWQGVYGNTAKRLKSRYERLNYFSR